MSPSASLRSQVIKKSLDDKQARTNETVNEYEDAEKNYQPKTIKFWLPLIGMYLALFLVALDRTIIAVAIPKITDEFNSIADIGWYGSSYMLTAACVMPISGRLYQLYSTKVLYITSIVIFEAGSALCGAAPSSVALIIGRAIAGIGSSGIFSGGMMLVLPLVPLRKRPLYTSFFGMVFALASVIAPLVGGSFTDKVTWRWCFYINLPVGGFTILATLLFLHIDPPKHENYTLFQQLRRLDPVGVLFFVPAMVCLVLALQWGGTTYTWSSGRVIGLLVTYAVLFVIFIVVEVLTPDTAMAPMRVVLNRSVAGSMTYTFLLSGGMMVIIYYFTIWFQAAKGDSAIRSGIATIPLVLSLVLASIISAVVTQKIGYYVPAMIISCVMCAIGSGLLSTLKVDSYHGYWIGYQVLYGLGVGCGFQQSNLSVQTVLKRQDVPLGIALMFLQQQMGGSIFLSVSQSIFSNKLVNKLSGVAGLDPHVIVNTGATDLRKVVPVNELSTVVSAYSYALTRTFLLAAILSACMILGAGVVEWRSIKEKNTHKSEGESEESKLEQGQAAQEKSGGYS